MGRGDGDPNRGRLRRNQRRRPPYATKFLTGYDRNHYAKGMGRTRGRRTGHVRLSGANYARSTSRYVRSHTKISVKGPGRGNAAKRRGLFYESTDGRDGHCLPRSRSGQYGSQCGPVTRSEPRTIYRFRDVTVQPGIRSRPRGSEYCGSNDAYFNGMILCLFPCVSYRDSNTKNLVFQRLGRRVVFQFSPIGRVSSHHCRSDSRRTSRMRKVNRRRNTFLGRRLNGRSMS